jgi:GrpB-like predicted nucleotidyltransferase (UPF0157 family)/GNAT superfamily N-acetyltransferase
MSGPFLDTSHVTLSEPDETWAQEFEHLAAGLRTALAGLRIEVEHVGSTSVPGLAAKPILDVDIVLASASDLPIVTARLERLGYKAKGMRGVSGREAFDMPPGPPAHHLYAVVAGTRAHLDHVLLRDLLRSRPDLAARYEVAKRANAHLLPDDRMGYTDAKTEVITELLTIARVQAGLPADPTAVEIEDVIYQWRLPVPDDEVVALHTVAFAESSAAEPMSWRKQRPLSLGWVTAIPAADESGVSLIGFANVAWDGDRHAFLLDVAVHPDHQRRGIAPRIVERAAEEAQAAGCEWLHVDFEERLADFYFDSCGFTPTMAGLLRLWA